MKAAFDKQISDVELFSLLKKGDEDAYREIYQRYSAQLYVHAYKRLQDREECRDIVQSLFLTIWVKRTELDIKTNPSHYLYTCVRNSIFNLLEKKKAKDNCLESIKTFSETYTTPADEMARTKQFEQIILREINDLPNRTREIFMLSRYNNLSHDEIARQLDLSEQTVKTTVKNALKVLRKRLNRVLLFFLTL